MQAFMYKCDTKLNVSIFIQNERTWNADRQLTTDLHDKRCNIDSDPSQEKEFQGDIKMNKIHLYL